MIPLIVDNFAGGGGASTGIEMALGRPVDIAINHDAEALSLHAANHPGTMHLTEDVWAVDPCALTAGRPAGLVWFSPDCKHFSKAKGGTPKDKNIRGLAWVMVKWAESAAPAVMILENVEEFQTWGPLLRNGNACPRRKGQTFRQFVRRLRSAGYKVEWRELRACDFGAPTIRKRLFLIARRDGRPIIWPKPTHGKPGTDAVNAGVLQPWRTAAECIDWSIPCPSIFERARPLADATMRRIARGIRKFVIDSADPFIVKFHSAKRPGDDRVGSIDEPLRTQCAEVKGGHFALAAAHLVRQFGNSIGNGLAEPVGTITAGGGGKTSLCSSFLAKLYGTTTGQEMSQPMHTVTSGGNHIAEVRAFLIKYYGEGGQWQDCRDPMHTIPTKDRLGLVTIQGEDYVITDIGLRMLEPHELFAAQGFPANYAIPSINGRKLSKSSQVRMCGNSVCPPVAAAIVAANVPELSIRPIAKSA